MSAVRQQHRYKKGEGLYPEVDRKMDDKCPIILFGQINIDFPGIVFRLLSKEIVLKTIQFSLLNKLSFL